jgi:hypothetical protein
VEQRRVCSVVAPAGLTRQIGGGGGVGNGKINLARSVLRTVNRRIKFINDQQMHFDFIDAVLLYCGH